MSSHEAMSAPSDTLVGRFRGLHPITRGLTGVAALHLLATLISIFGHSASNGATADSYEWTGRLGSYARSVSYSLLLFGTPATVEFLYRISVELRLMRLAKGADPAEK